MGRLCHEAVPLHSEAQGARNMKHRKRNRGLILQILVILTALSACDFPWNTSSDPVIGDFTGFISNWPYGGCNADIGIQATDGNIHEQYLDALVVNDTPTCTATVYIHADGSADSIPMRLPSISVTLGAPLGAPFPSPNNWRRVHHRCWNM